MRFSYRENAKPGHSEEGVTSKPSVQETIDLGEKKERRTKKKEARTVETRGKQWFEESLTSARDKQG